MTQPVADDDAEAIRLSLDRPEAFAVLFERHARDVHAWLCARVGPDLGGDLLAETFMRAFDRRSRFDPALARSARPWLFGIASNLVADHHRREQRRLRAFARIDLPGHHEDHADRAATRADAAALGALVAGVLAELRPEDRETVLLIAWAELDYNDTAAALGIAVGTVKSRISRVRAVMATKLAGHVPALEER